MEVSKEDIKSEVKTGIHKASRYGKKADTIVGDVDKLASYKSLERDIIARIVRNELDKPVFGCITLVKDGEWQVPVEKRPKGWEKIRLWKKE